LPGNRRLIGLLLTLLAVFTVGTVGYMIIEDWSLLDSFYMTLITLTTVGYGEIHRISPEGRLFTSILIFSGVGLVFYTIGAFTQVMVEGQLRNILGKRKLENQIKKLSGHVIICGFGRCGTRVAEVLQARDMPFVAVEKDEDTILALNEMGYLYLHADATLDATLMDANIKEARTLVAALPSDAQNLYVSLTARELNPELYIVARAEEEASVLRLKRAGADRVISPYTIAANHLARAVIHPTVVDFIELANQTENMELEISEITVGRKYSENEVSLRESGLRENYGVIIVAIRKTTGAMLFNPPTNTVLQAGDKLVALGSVEGIRDLELAMIDD